MEEKKRKNPRCFLCGSQMVEKEVVSPSGWGASSRKRILRCVKCGFCKAKPSEKWLDIY